MRAHLLFPLFCTLSPLWAQVHTDLAFSAGLQTDSFRQTYELGGVSQKIEFDHITSPTIEANFLVSFNCDLYLRGFWAGAVDPYHFKKKTFQNNTLISTVDGDKVHLYSALAAIGWQFDFYEGRYALCLESGLLINQMKYKLDGSNYLRTYSPFIGTLIHLPLNRRWFVDVALDYTFASSRYEAVENVSFNRGSFQGPLGSLSIGFDINRAWSLSLDWKTHYLFTDKISLSALRDERTDWFMNRFLLHMALTF